MERTLRFCPKFPPELQKRPRFRNLCWAIASTYSICTWPTYLTSMIISSSLVSYNMLIWSTFSLRTLKPFWNSLCVHFHILPSRLSIPADYIFSLYKISPFNFFIVNPSPPSYLLGLVASHVDGGNLSCISFFLLQNLYMLLFTFLINTFTSFHKLLR